MSVTQHGFRTPPSSGCTGLPSPFSTSPLMAQRISACAHRARRRSPRTCPPSVPGSLPSLDVVCPGHGAYRNQCPGAAPGVPVPPAQPHSPGSGWSSLRLSSPVPVVSALRRCRSALLRPRVCPMLPSPLEGEGGRGGGGLERARRRRRAQQLPEDSFLAVRDPRQVVSMARLWGAPAA